MVEILFALTFIFVLAALLLLVAAQMGVPVTPFYLLAGILAGTIIDEGQLLDLAQWGIAFLVFLFGINFDLEALRTTGRLSTAVAVTQAAIVGLGAFGAGLLFGLDELNAVYFAVAAALSSSIVAISYLDSTEGSLPTFGQLAESIHFIEDILGVCIVLLLSAFIYANGSVGLQFAVGGGMILSALVIRYLLFHRLTERLEGDAEVMMLIGISFVAVFIAVSELFGISIVVGAFAAGIAIADDYPHSLEFVDTIDDLEDFFSPIFFITVGALVTVPGLPTGVYTVALIVAIMILNPLIVALLLLRSGFDGRNAIRTALTVDQVSVFSLFIAIEALAEGMITRPVFDAIVLAAVVTLFAASFTGHKGEALTHLAYEYQFVQRFGLPPADRSNVEDTLSEHVIIVDFQESSQPFIEASEAVERSVLVIEDNPTNLEQLEDWSESYIYGDVLDDRLWELAQLEDAALVISFTPEQDRNTHIAKLDVNVPRIVRTDTQDIAYELAQYDSVGVLDPYAVAGERFTAQLENWFAGESLNGDFTDLDAIRSDEDWD